MPLPSKVQDTLARSLNNLTVVSDTVLHELAQTVPTRQADISFSFCLTSCWRGLKWKLPPPMRHPPRLPTWVLRFLLLHALDAVNTLEAMEAALMISRRGCRPRTRPLWMAQRRLRALALRMMLTLGQVGAPRNLVRESPALQLWPQSRRVLQRFGRQRWAQPGGPVPDRAEDWRTLAGEPLPLVGNLQLIQLWACRVACSDCSQAHCVRTFQQRSSSWHTEHLCRSANDAPRRRLAQLLALALRQLPPTRSQLWIRPQSQLLPIQLRPRRQSSSHQADSYAADGGWADGSWWLGQLVEWQKLVIYSMAASTSAAAEPAAPFSALMSVTLAMLDVGAVPFPVFEGLRFPALEGGSRIPLLWFWGASS